MKAELPDIDQLAKGLFRRIPRGVRLAFLSAFALGLVIHLYMLTGKYPNHDDVLCLFEDDALLECGRWFGVVLCALSSNFSMPWVNGLFSLLALAGTAALLAATFELKRPVQIVLLSAALTAFPAVGNTLAFMFTVDGYFAGLLLGAIGAYLADRGSWKLVPLAALLVLLCTATYQAYLCFVVAILAVRGLQLLLSGRLTNKEVGCKVAQYAAVLLAAVIAYLLLTKLFLRVTDTPVSTYMGIDSMGKLALSDIPRMVWDAYYGFFYFAFYTSGQYSGVWLSAAHLLLGVLTALFTVLTLARGGRTKLQTVLAAVLLLLMPLLLNTAYLLGAGLVHILMMESVVLMYYLLVTVFEQYRSLSGRKTAGGNRLSALSSYAVALVLALSAFSFAIYTNQCYLMMQLKYESAYALAGRVTDRIETHEDYEPGMPVALLGEAEWGNYPHAKDGNFGKLGRGEGFGSSGEFALLYDDRHFKDFTRFYLGVDFGRMDTELLYKLERSAQFQAMPCYPDTESVQVIDGVLVIKMGQGLTYRPWEP